MITTYFGLAGCGKSSILTLIAQKELKRIAKGKSKYTKVYTNFPCIGCEEISIKVLGKYYLHDALIILDEITLSADSRDWKNFPKEAKEFVCLHRHFNTDLIVSVQDYSRCEKTIREMTNALYYVSRGMFWSTARPIYRTIAINEYIGDLIQGYRFPTFWEAITGNRIYIISRAWKYYDSFDKYGFDSKSEYQGKVYEHSQKPKAVFGEYASKLLKIAPSSPFYQSDVISLLNSKNGQGFDLS